MRVIVKFHLDRGDPKVWCSPEVEAVIREICETHGVCYSNVVFEGLTKTCELNYVDEDKHRNNILMVEQYVNSLGLFCSLTNWNVIQSDELALLRQLKNSLNKQVAHYL